MVTESAEAAWRAYDTAISGLGGSNQLMPIDRGPEPTDIGPDADRGRLLVERSSELGLVLAERLSTTDLDERNLASLKLIAAATVDLHVATELMVSPDADNAGRATRGTERTISIPRDVREILDAPLGDGVSGLLPATRAAVPADPGAARKALEQAIQEFVADIPKNSAEILQRSVIGTATLGVPVLSAAAGDAVSQVLAHMPTSLSHAIKQAAGLVLEAIKKLRAAFGFGQDQEDQARVKVAGWFKELEDNRDTATALLDTVFETKRVTDATMTAVRDAPDYVEAAQFNQATEDLKKLIGADGKTKDMLTLALRGIGLAATPLLGLSPWGPLAVAAAYVAIGGYAVYSGADYLDTYWSPDWLDHVDGLRKTVTSALA